MKIQSLLAAAATLFLCACNANQTEISIQVSNPLDIDRNAEMVEVSMEKIAKRLNLADTAQIIVLDAKGTQLPYQITYDEKLIFPATVTAKGNVSYTITTGEPVNVDVVACGQVYPNRYDDLAWENDLAGFRAYGPATQARGERGFGYDIFTKRGTKAPVLESLYAKETSPEIRKRLEVLRKTDPEAAKVLSRERSYHVDHGYGMDCYAVGPTLGAGIAALVSNDTIVYPWCYKQVEILDNGPLRFTAKLIFNPQNVEGNDHVIETRVISLDANSHLNRTSVSFSNLEKSHAIVAGIVLHEPDGVTKTEAEEGYMTYVDPTTGTDNGKIFMGMAFPEKIDDAKVVLFSQEEKMARNKADGHILATSQYKPNDTFTYYWGFGWDRADIESIEVWNNYMKDFAQKVRNPLQVSF